MNEELNVLIRFAKAKGSSDPEVLFAALHLESLLQQGSKP